MVPCGDKKKTSESKLRYLSDIVFFFTVQYFLFLLQNNLKSTDSEFPKPPQIDEFRISKMSSNRQIL